MTLGKIISGGQTGVDRGALDAALDAAFPCGGFCPPGREAEDGAIPPRYPLEEIPAGGYLERTVRNVETSDGTLLLDAARIPPADAARLAASFVAAHRIAVLNVAGPRASQDAAGHDHAYATIAALIGRAVGPRVD